MLPTAKSFILPPIFLRIHIAVITCTYLKNQLKNPYLMLLSTIHHPLFFFWYFLCIGQHFFSLASGDIDISSINFIVNKNAVNFFHRNFTASHSIQIFLFHMVNICQCPDVFKIPIDTFIKINLLFPFLKYSKWFTA